MKPTAAPAHFPYNHRTLAQVDRDHQRSLEGMRRKRALERQERALRKAQEYGYEREAAE